MMAFSVLLVDYCTIENTLGYIKLCSEEILSSEKLSFFITDVSPLASGLEFLRKEYKEVAKISFNNNLIYKFIVDGIIIYLIPAYANLGYARGNNLAAMASIELFPNNDFLVSNNDILFHQKCNLDDIKELFEKCDYAVIGPDVIQDGNHINPMYDNKRVYYLFIMYLNTILPKKIKAQIDKDNYTFAGCFWFFNHKFFNMVGGFDENTFMYFEEQIMKERMKEVGGKLFFYNGMSVVHAHASKRQTYKSAMKYISIVHESCDYYVKTYLKPSAVQLICSNIFYHLVLIPFLGERILRDIVYFVYENIKNKGLREEK